jgi:hypothetical protein
VSYPRQAKLGPNGPIGPPEERVASVQVTSGPARSGRWARAGRRCTALAAVVLGLAAASAQAAPRVWIEDVYGERFGQGQQCVAHGTTLVVGGSGFVPGARVSMNGHPLFRVGRGGAFGALVEARTDRAEERVAYRFAQRAAGRTVRATLRVWVSARGAEVPSWTQDGPSVGTRGKVEHVRVGGFDWAIGRPLWVHYSQGDRVRFSQRLGVLRGPCGAAEVRMTQFPFPAEAGLYRVSFSSATRFARDAPGSWYPGVRIGPPVPPASPPPATLFTIAGDLAGAGFAEQAPASTLALPRWFDVAPAPDGGFVLVTRGRVLAVDPSGRARTLAGTGVPGFSGDGGPATAAKVNVSAIAEDPTGGYLLAECANKRIRRVAPDGTITTIAQIAADEAGVQLLANDVNCPVAVARLPDGTVAFINRLQRYVFQVMPDGTTGALAGNGDYPDDPPERGPALKLPIDPDGLTVADGRLLIADSSADRVYALADGKLTTVAGSSGAYGALPDDGLPAIDAAVTPVALAARPGGGFYLLDMGALDGVQAQPRVRAVEPDGRIFTLAGTGRAVEHDDSLNRDGLRGDGMPPSRADLRDLHSIAVLRDGGIIVAEGAYDALDARAQTGGLVRYLPPPAGGMLAVAVRRDRDRLFQPERPAATTVVLRSPATVTLTVFRGAQTAYQTQLALPAGESRLPLPALEGVPHVITVDAVDDTGRVAHDRAALLPRGWLADELARDVANAKLLDAIDASTYTPDGITGCRRLAPSRVDCRVAVADKGCDAVVTVRLGVDGRLRWGSYRCPISVSAPLVHRLRPMSARDTCFEPGGSGCLPPVTGIVPDRWLVPWG